MTVVGTCDRCQCILLPEGKDGDGRSVACDLPDCNERRWAASPPPRRTERMIDPRDD